MKIDYVVSAPAQGLLPSHRLKTLDYKDDFLAPVRDIFDTVMSNINRDCGHYEPLVSLLFNAYTEVCYIPCYKHFSNFQLSSVYADSGGLQIVTAGREADSGVKQRIYEAQAYADYAMIFDEIPLDVTKVYDHNGNVVKSRNERSNYNNKIFDQDRHEESAIQTGRNVKEQIEAFKKLGAKTKVVLIVQGNTTDDFQLYHDKICDELEDDDYGYIDGLALADTCIGNGELESIGMLQAAKRISRNTHPNISRHLHILGVGSVKRLRPIICLKRSGYLDTFEHISYDSSSHTSCFTYGLLKLNGTCKALGKEKTDKGTEYWNKVYDFFPTLSQFGSRERWLEIIYGNGHENWGYAAVKERGRTGKFEDYFLAHVTKMCYTLYMIHNFCWNVNKMFTEHNSLLTVKDDHDIVNWLSQISKTDRKRSKAIRRKDQMFNLNEFFT